MVLLTLKAVATGLKRLVYALYNKTITKASEPSPLAWIDAFDLLPVGPRKVALLCAPLIWVPCTFFRPSPPLFKFSSYNPAPARRLVGDCFFTSAVFGLRLPPSLHLVPEPLAIGYTRSPVNYSCCTGASSLPDSESAHWPVIVSLPVSSRRRPTSFGPELETLTVTRERPASSAGPPPCPVNPDSSGLSPRWARNLNLGCPPAYGLGVTHERPAPPRARLRIRRPTAPRVMHERPASSAGPPTYPCAPDFFGLPAL